MGGNEVNVKDIMLPLIHKIHLILMSLPFYLACPNSPRRGGKRRKREGDRKHRAGETQKSEAKSQTLFRMGMGEVQVWARPQLHLHSHFLAPSRREGARRKALQHQPVVPRGSPIHPHLAHLSGPSLPSRLCLEHGGLAQPNLLYTQVAISSSEQGHPLARQMWLERVMRKCQER